MEKKKKKFFYFNSKIGKRSLNLKQSPMPFSFSFFQHGIYQNFYRTITLYYNSIVLISWPITDQRLIPTSFFFPSQEAIGNRKGSRPRKEESAPILSVSRNIRDMVFHRVIDAQLTQLNFFQSLLIFSPPLPSIVIEPRFLVRLLLGLCKNRRKESFWNFDFFETKREIESNYKFSLRRTRGHRVSSFQNNNNNAAIKKERSQS